jgi:hypothetical protein
MGTSVQPLKKLTANGKKYSSAAYPYNAMNYHNPRDGNLVLNSKQPYETAL